MASAQAITTDQPLPGATVFVVVKQRRNTTHGAPGEFITPSKAALVRRAALIYLAKDDVPCQFDTILITGDERCPSLEWLKGAF